MTDPAAPIIHPTAQVDAGVTLAAGARVGAFAVIEAPAGIGPGCTVDAHAVIHGGVRLGARNRVGAHAVLGGVPQDLSFDPDCETWLQIGDDNVFREGVTVNRGSAATGVTRIGDRGFFMNNAHVAHDCRVGDDVVMASCTALGGHVEVADRVFIGGGAMVHQFSRIGTLAMIAGVTPVRKDVLPYALIAGDPARHYRPNLIGMRRLGLDAARRRALSRAYRLLRAGEYDALASIDTPEVRHLRRWLDAPSRRGLTGFVRAGGGDV